MTGSQTRGGQVRSIGFALAVLALSPVLVSSGCSRKPEEPVAGPSGGGPWQGRGGRTVPDKYATLKNPIPAGEETIAAGKALYDQHCVGCHGVKGRGDGPKAPQLRRTPPDFADARSAAGMTDGAIFWRMTEKVGSEMPGFAGKLNENERWQVLHYLRTLAPKTAGKAAG